MTGHVKNEDFRFCCTKICSMRVCPNPSKTAKLLSFHRLCPLDPPPPGALEQAPGSNAVIRSARYACSTYWSLTFLD